MNKTIYILKTFDRWDEHNPWDIVGFVTTLDEALDWVAIAGTNHHRYDEVHQMKSKNLNQIKVDESLNSAINNGYELDDWCVKDIAIDLHSYDSAFEGVDIDDLVPFVKIWKNQRKS